MNSTTIAVDVAKAVFEVAVSEHAGQVRERHRFSRERFRRYLGEQPPATILMEACGSAHYWGREAQTRGHRVVLLPPHAVRPYVVRNKTDRTDAKALLEATRNDEVRPVPVKSETQQALAALHRLRSAWLATRTARISSSTAPRAGTTWRAPGLVSQAADRSRHGCQSRTRRARPLLRPRGRDSERRRGPTRSGLSS